MKDTNNYYEILEVNENASIEVIEKAYKVLAKKYHPDIYEGDKKEAETLMKKLNEAYDILSNESKRKNYDTILEKKKQLKFSSNSTSSSAQNTSDYQIQNINNNTVKYNNDDFVINTTYMDEKQKRKIEKKLQERYVEANDNYLRSRGYKLKYKWTFKRVFNVILIIACILITFTILFFIPPIHEYLINLYNNNIILKVLVDIVVSIFYTFFSTIKTIFKNIFNIK